MIFGIILSIIVLLILVVINEDIDLEFIYLCSLKTEYEIQEVKKESRASTSLVG